jgi:transcriptional regulator with PAS, ATPase and Fis domain
LFSLKPSRRVFILDELNSLDYDMQGSLLRLLENSEVVSMFSTGEPQWIDALIIGIVNEDPEKVTRESELRLLEDAEEFLGKAEAARLYEALHHARRLRPDLVYRLRRGVYVQMPPLRERREDIPLLFKHPCSEHIRTLCTDCLSEADEPDVLVEYELEAYDTLMRRDLPWPGNIRQLQSVARRVADEVWVWWKHQEENKATVAARKPLSGNRVKIEVRRAQVEKVLRKTFPEQMGRLDDYSD